MKQKHSLSTLSLCTAPLFHYVLAALALFLLFAFAACPLQAKAAENHNIRNIRDEIQHADTYYWLGMFEKGNVDAFHRGLSHLAAASTLLKKNHHDIPSKDTAQLNLEIETLYKDLHKQLKVHCDTLYGVFPLMRLLQPTLFSDPLATRTFELVDNPDVMASTAAGYKLCHQVLKSLSGRTQFHILFNSIPRNIELENEMVNIFNKASGFFVHNQRELVEIIDVDQLKNFHNGKISFRTQQQINQALDTKQFLLVTIRKIDQINRNYFYIVDGQVYNYDKDKTYHCASMGFSRNRNGQFWPVVLSQIALFLTIIFFPCFTAAIKENEKGLKSLYFAAPIAGFILGRFIPWLLIPVLSPMAPKPDTLAILSFWWPLGLLFFLFTIPVFIYYLSNSFFQTHIPSLAINNRGGLIMVSVALGVCAYLATPIYLYAENKGIMILLALVLASIFLFYHLGNLIDPSESIEHDLLTILILFLLFVQGGIIVHLEVSFIWVYTVILIFLLTFIHYKKVIFQFLKDQLFKRKKCTDQKTRNISPTVNANPPKTIEELKTYTLNPPFIYETSLFGELKEQLDKANSETIRIGVSGDQGVGKTTVITNILSRKKQQFNDRFLILFGNCPKPLKSAHNALPYAPFQSILATTIGIDIMGSGDHKVKSIGTLFGTIIHTIIPTFQLSAELNSKPCESCLNDVYYNIAQRLRKLSEKQPVAIVIDDLQWIDEDSTALLLYLLKAFPEDRTNNGNKHAVIIILTGDDKEQIKDLLKKNPVEIRLTSEDQQNILMKSLNIAPASATELIKYIEGASENQQSTPMKKKGMNWVFKIIYWLAQNYCLELNKKHNQWIINKKIMATTVIPDELAKVINDRLEKVKENKLLIMHAACLGEIFSGKILADSLRMDKYDVYQILAEIEKNTDLIIDIKTDDEYYKFQSPFDLNAVREFFGIIDDSIDNVSQVVRECFARTAAAMENDPRFSNKIYEIANHYCHAGYAYASKSTKYCLLAARYACNHYQFDTARKYLEKCGEYASDIHACSKTMAQELEEEALIVSCYEAHVTGKNRQTAAENGLKYVEEHQNTPFRIYATVIRACYDAKSTETVTLGKKILKRFNEPAQQAEAYQFIGIATSSLAEEKKNLNQAINLLEAYLENNHDDNEAQGLLGRILNSLAKSYANAKNIDEAKKFFNQSITVKEKVNDTLGLSMSHGGLGRMAMHNYDFDEAIPHFEKNLFYAEQAGDFYTPFYTNSNLGDCYLGKERPETDAGKRIQLKKQALKYFELSFKFLLENEQKSNFEEIKKKLGSEIKNLFKKIKNCLDSLDSNGNIESLKSKLNDYCSRNNITF
jgi:tetratricopeptide (TPR) repeat protein